MERHGCDLDVRLAKPFKRGFGPRLKLCSRILVVSQHDDRFGADNLPMHGIDSLCDHRGGLTRARRCDNLNPVVKAHHRLCLLVSQRLTFYLVENLPAVTKLSLRVQLVALFPCARPIRRPSFDIEFSLGITIIQMGPHLWGVK